jgi:hypothetical protein
MTDRVDAGKAKALVATHHFRNQEGVCLSGTIVL